MRASSCQPTSPTSLQSTKSLSSRPLALYCLRLWQPKYLWLYTNRQSSQTSLVARRVCSFWDRCSYSSTCNGDPLEAHIYRKHCSGVSAKAWVHHTFCRRTLNCFAIFLPPLVAFQSTSHCTFATQLGRCCSSTECILFLRLWRLFYRPDHWVILGYSYSHTSKCRLPWKTKTSQDLTIESQYSFKRTSVTMPDLFHSKSTKHAALE